MNFIDGALGRLESGQELPRFAHVRTNFDAAKNIPLRLGLGLERNDRLPRALVCAPEELGDEFDAWLPEEEL